MKIIILTALIAHSGWAPAPALSSAIPALGAVAESVAGPGQNGNGPAWFCRLWPSLCH